MRHYKPQTPFSVPLILLNPTSTMVKGVRKDVYPDPKNGIPFNGSIRTFGGTENMSNDVYTIFDTATLDTWYRPDLTSDSRIYFCETGETWSVKGRPEDIDMRHQFMQVKLQRIGGKP